MLLQHVSYFSHIFWCGTQLHKSVLVNWNRKSMRLTVSKNEKKEVGMLRLKQRVHMVCLLLVLAQGLLSLYKQEMNFFDKFIWGIEIVLWASDWAYYRTLNRESKNLCLYINGLVDFYRLYGSNSVQKSSLMELANLLYAYGVYLTVFGFPILFIYFIHGLNPCKPTLVGYWILPECNNAFPDSSNWLWIIPKLALLLFNHWVWSFGIVNALVAVSAVQMLCTMELNNSLKTFAEKYINDKLAISCAVSQYRMLQILAILMNNLIKTELNATIAGSCTVLLSLSEAAVVKLTFTETNLVALIVFGFMSVNALIAVVVILGGLAQLFATSTNTLHRMKRHSSVTMVTKKRIMQQRFLRSCSPLKVRLGSINFVDSLTPLNFVNFGNGLAVQLLLVGDLHFG